ncbi:hypothetical protein V1478_015533 [Vespula squamosa]|uniref:Uncharacterized protein n=1 Tax=Vespula squamosa TaxID=30214 RepID=A0ABD2A7X8_VESSQ
MPLASPLPPTPNNVGIVNDFADWLIIRQSITLIGRSLGRCSSNSSVVVVVAEAAAGNDSTNDKMLMVVVKVEYLLLSLRTSATVPSDFTHQCKHEYERLSCPFGKAQDFSVHPRFLSAPPPPPPSPSPSPLSSSARDDVL